ncbi:MAG: hypothetical protein ACPGUY_02015 [Akkermansiaceae bacterium]
MKPVSSIIRRGDGLRTIDAQFKSIKTYQGPKTRIATSRLQRLRQHDSTRPLTKGERELLGIWFLLGKAKLSVLTYRLLVILCARTTAAPVCNTSPVPRLSNKPTDVRPWLCDPAAVASLLRQLQEYDAARPIGKRLCDPSDSKVVYDPWFLFRSGEKIRLGENEISPVVWERIAGFTTKLCYKELLAIEALYQQHAHEQDWCALVEIILGHTKGETGRNWLRLFASLPATVRRKEVEFWMMNFPRVKHCPGALVFLAKPAWLLETTEAHALHYLWRGMKYGASTNQLRNAIELWKVFDWSYGPQIFEGESVEIHSLIRLTKLLTTRENHGRIAHETWAAMHTQPELQASFDALGDEPYGHRGWLFRILREARYDNRDDALAAEFNRDFVELSRVLLGIPQEYHGKASYYFIETYWDRSTKFSAADLMRQIAALCAKPFTTSSDGDTLWCKLMSDWDAQELPLSCWKRIDHAGRSRNHLNALETGLDRLNDKITKPVLKAGLKLRVRLSLDIVRLAGRVSKMEVDAAVALLKEHPLLDVSLDQPNDIETYRHLVSNSKDLTIWQRHLTGEKKVRAESADRIRTELEGRRIEILLSYLLGEIAPQEARTEGLQLHTRLYANYADENRRAYGKLIKRYSAQGENGILFHPRNQHWLHTHRYVRQGVWLTGLRAEIVLTDGRRVFLEMERRFEQVLKMGTLVNSCLALDGINSHSALANAADVNKQVVMAYDDEQRFLGRQLVGIAEERRLVCFDVYGQNEDQLLPAFSAFDCELEKLMALPIQREGDYQLKPLVCREWYDDYAWSPPSASDAKIINLQWGGSRAVVK